MAALFVNIRSEVGLPLKSQQKNDVRLLLTDPLQLTQLHNLCTIVAIYAESV